MTRYLVTIEVEAEDPQDAILKVRSPDLYPTRIYEVKEKDE